MVRRRFAIIGVIINVLKGDLAEQWPSGTPPARSRGSGRATDVEWQPRRLASFYSGSDYWNFVRVTSSLV